MKKELKGSKLCPSPGETFELAVGSKIRRCKLVFSPGVKVETGDVDQALARLNQSLNRHGLTPQNGELEAFAKAYPRAKELVGVAFKDGPVMFKCANNGRLISSYVDGELSTVLLWLVVCEQ